MTGILDAFPIHYSLHTYVYNPTPCPAVTTNAGYVSIISSRTIHRELIYLQQNASLNLLRFQPSTATSMLLHSALLSGLPRIDLSQASFCA